MFVDEANVTLQRNDRTESVTLCAAHRSSPSDVIPFGARHCDGLKKYLVTVPMEAAETCTCLDSLTVHVEWCPPRPSSTLSCPKAGIPSRPQRQQRCVRHGTWRKKCLDSISLTQRWTPLRCCEQTCLSWTTFSINHFGQGV